MSETCINLSPQEEAISKGLTIQDAGSKGCFAHKRFAAIARRAFASMTPYVDVHRARLFTESMKETEGQPLVLRYALAMQRLAEKLPVYIEKDQLLVGRVGTDRAATASCIRKSSATSWAPASRPQETI